MSDCDCECECSEDTDELRGLENEVADLERENDQLRADLRALCAAVRGHIGTHRTAEDSSTLDALFRAVEDAEEA